MQYNNNGAGFPGFPKLPKEVRDKIWDLAVQNRTRSREAHFFRLYDKQDFERVWIKDSGSNEYQERTVGLHQKTFHIGPPAWGRQASRDIRVWNARQNPSAYSLTSGLWHACAESRRAVVRCWKQEDKVHCPGWQRNDEAEEYIQDVLKAHATSKTWIVENGTEKTWLISRDNYDLFVFQIDGIRAIPERTTPYVIDALWQFAGLSFNPENIGFEFNPQWLRDLSIFDKYNAEICHYGCSMMNMDFSKFQEKGGSASLSVLCQELEDLYYRSYTGWVWFIDSRLRPRPDLDYKDLVDDNAMVFMGRGRRYVQVTAENVEKGWILSGGDTSSGVGHEYAAFQRSAAAFTRKLEEEIFWSFPHDEPDLSDLEFWRPGKDEIIRLDERIGVLACLYDTHVKP